MPSNRRPMSREDKERIVFSSLITLMSALAVAVHGGGAEAGLRRG